MINKFREFFTAVNPGETPFPWQEQIIKKVLETGNWPDTIDAPTGLGKTSLLDIAVFLLATTIDRRVSRRRIFFIVNRRLVVDEAFEHAKALAAALRDSAEGNPLQEIAQSLRNLYGGGPEDPALIVQRMRGGTTWDSSWVDRPDQPAVVTGTIDQVGSRAFFRGYGTSNGRKPMDAALVMMDSLLLIDEAHIAQALADNIGRAREADRPEVELPVKKAAVVLMSATPALRVGEGKATTPAFDVEANLTHPVARERLLADKSLRLAKVVDRQRVPTTLSAVTLDLLKERPGARALVVCNTVHRARATREEIRRGLKTSGLHLIPDSDEPDAMPQVKLLIGRSRPVDRDAVVKKLLKSFGMRRTRVEGETGVDILVATQTVEVGANLDVDILVTESAPLDALAQRLGRLNRAGRSKHQPIAVVVHDGQLETVYGDARLAAWDYLSSSLAFDERFPESTTLRAGHRDAGPLAVRKLLETAPPEASTRWDEAPIVTTPVLDTWVQTGPIPDLDTQVSQYLHGYQRRDTDVLVCWRDDLTTAGGQMLERNLSAIMTATSPLAEELVEVPLRALRSWLMGGKNTDAADFDAPVDEGRTPEAEAQLVVHRNDRWQITHPNRIRPGEIVVVASDRGGLDEFGWNPGSREPAQDIWEIASMRRGRTVLRLDERTLERILSDAPDRSTVEAANEAIRDLVRALANPEMNDLPEGIIRIPTKAGKLLQSLGFTDKSDQDDGSEETDAVGAAIWLITKFGKDGHVREPYVQIVQDLDKAQKFEKSQDRVEVVAITDDRLLLTLPKRAGKRERRQQPSGEDASELGSSASTHEVTLDQHHANVRRRAEEIARNVGLTDPVLTQVVADAAGFHDLGKLDLRFQASLRRGDRIAAETAAEPLAKSDMDPRSTEARRARRVAQVPAGFRHETWSARLVSQSAPVSGDPRIHDLLVHLVASHHGHSRPLLPIVMDADPQELSHNGWTALTEGAASVDFEGPRRFLDLNAWLGRWGLAYLETIVRSADQTCSMEGT